MPRSAPVEDGSSKGDVPIRFRSQRIPLNSISLAFFDETHLSALVRCELEQVSLDEKPSYAAISCCRESLLEFDHILCHENRVNVSPNLTAALCLLRQPETIGALWADCQDDVPRTLTAGPNDEKYL
jgi:hypothetical protein